MACIYTLEVAHALDAGGKERRIAERLKDRLPRRRNRDLTDNVQNTVSCVGCVA